MAGNLEICSDHTHTDPAVPDLEIQEAASGEDVNTAEGTDWAEGKAESSHAEDS